jgi:phosphate transport system protein
MIRKTLDRGLQALQDEMLVLGSMAAETISEAVRVLRERNIEAAKELIEGDSALNEKRFSIEAEALMLIATQQPMAVDLRVVATVLQVTSELERIGDYAKGIAKVVILMGDAPLLKPLVDVPRMAEKARAMLERALEAFSNRDVSLARSIPAEDDAVDNLYNQVYRELMTYVIADPTNMDQANLLLWVAHNLERAADRVINICERVVFMVTGEMQEMDTPDTDGISEHIAS